MREERRKRRKRQQIITLVVCALAVAALIGFSRMYLFVHFPTDVLFGAVLGAALAVLTVWALNRLCDWLAARRAAQNGGGNPQA